jgi:predicted RNase H-like nuclease (RuvC/YqgF family)
MQYLVFEYVDKNLLEILEEHPSGLDLEQVLWSNHCSLGAVHEQSKRYGHVMQPQHKCASLAARSALLAPERRSDSTSSSW